MLRRRKQQGVSISDKIVKEPGFKEAIIEKIKKGLEADPNYKLLLEKLVDPVYRDEKDFLKEQMREIIRKTQGYLEWSERNRGEVEESLVSIQFEDEVIDLYIRDPNSTDSPGTLKKYFFYLS